MAVKYTMGIASATRNLIHVKAEFPVTGKKAIQLQLPAWRPGRYELGNFAKNIRQIVFYNEKGVSLGFRKITKDCWEIQPANSKTILAEYTCSATELNAGSSYVNHQQLYVNPVNCCLYNPASIDTACTLELDLPWKKYDVAISLTKKGNVYHARDFHDLADSPFIASPYLRSFTFKVKNLPVTVWIMGDCQYDEKRIKEDFGKYTQKQLEVFGDCPAKQYHYLLQITPGLFYHGVEHLESTVVALGPGRELMQSRYDELLGVSCHEFYHVWNIKSIRPAEMYPYDYTRENYFETGYVAEGVTTYMGDLLLWQSEVFSDEQYVRELNGQIQKHSDNYGRFNYSVAQSSHDLWLDGYVPGVPGRKVSIYTEGCLLALCIDLIILKNTRNKKSLHTVMRAMYNHYYKKNKGYTAADYKKELEKVAGENLDWYFNDYLHGTEDYFKLLNKTLDYVGFELTPSPSDNGHERLFGMKIQENADISQVTTTWPGAPAAEKIPVNSRILAINGQPVKSDAARLISSAGKKVRITAVINEKVSEIELTATSKEYYPVWRFTQKQKVSTEQRNGFLAWKKGIC